MNVGKFAQDWLAHYRAVMEGEDLTDKLTGAVEILEATRGRGRKLVFAGNGASASIASHYALDYTKQVGIRSMAFNDAAFITAYGNDYGYENWVARAIEHHGHEGDTAILISTSGGSANIVNAAHQCREMGISVLAFSGFGEDNPLNQLGDVQFWAASRAYNVVEAVHGMWLGLLCDLLIGEREYGVKG